MAPTLLAAISAHARAQYSGEARGVVCVIRGRRRYQLIVNWYVRERGIALKQFDRADNWWNDGRSDLYTEGFQQADFVSLPPESPLEESDVILMQVRSRKGVPNHAAIHRAAG